MTPEQIIRLLDAGYTKADIDNMITPAPTAVSNIITPAPEAAPADSPVAAGPISEAEPEPVKEEPEQPDPLDDIKNQIAQLTTTVNTISKAVISPTLENVKPLGAEDVIIKFFKEVK